MKVLFFLTVAFVNAAVIFHSALAVENSENKCNSLDSFTESKEEYQKRCPEYLEKSNKEPEKLAAGNLCNSFKDACDNGTFDYKKFNKMVLERNLQYKAGEIQLVKEEYNREREEFPVKIQWKDWALGLTVIKDGTIYVAPEKARSLWNESQKNTLSLFIITDDYKGDIAASRIFLLYKDEEIQVSDFDTNDNPLTLKCDSFETAIQCDSRRLRAVNSYNQAIAKHEARYQAGTAHLEKDGYNQNDGKFPLTIEWAKFAQEWFKVSPKNNIAASLTEARQLWEEGEAKPVFVYFDKSKQEGYTDKMILFGLGREWNFEESYEEYEQKKEICVKRCEGMYRRDYGNYTADFCVLSFIDVACDKLHITEDECWETMVKAAKKAGPDGVCADYILATEYNKSIKATVEKCIKNCNNK